MFGSCLNYVTLRLLGQACENDALTKGRAWILSHGGASAIPQWGKIWLSVWHHISTKKNIVFLFAYMLACIYGNNTIIFQVIDTLKK